MSKNLISKLQQALNSSEIFSIVDDSFASGQVLVKLGFSTKGQYIPIVKKFLVDNEIDISHFTYNGKPKTKLKIKNCLNCGKIFYTEQRHNKEQQTCSKGCSNTYFRTTDKISLANYRKNALEFKSHKCEICNYNENVAALVVHHIDRDRNNNSLDNLLVLCANCHAIEHYTKL